MPGEGSRHRQSPQGRDDAFADLRAWRKVEVTGGDARAWLDDLVSANVAGVEPGRTVRSLLLSPTGQVRAEFTVAATSRGFLLLQDPLQPAAVGALLLPYVLSSMVEVADRTDSLSLFSLPPGAEPDISGLEDATVSLPSCLGLGIDLLTPPGSRDQALSVLGREWRMAGDDEVELWRVQAGLPRLGVDVLTEDLPQEAGWDPLVAFDKGCFLGQEAVARVRNLGHPRRVVLGLESDDALRAGDAVFAGGRRAGQLTSAVSQGEGSVALARVRWDARGGPFTSASGVPLRPRPRP